MNRRALLSCEMRGKYAPLPKAFPLLPLWEAANQKPSPGGRWRLSRKAKTTDEGEVITVTNPFLCNSLPLISHLRPAGFSFSAQGRSLRSAEHYSGEHY